MLWYLSSLCVPSVISVIEIFEIVLSALNSYLKVVVRGSSYELVVVDFSGRNLLCRPMNPQEESSEI